MRPKSRLWSSRLPWRTTTESTNNKPRKYRQRGPHGPEELEVNSVKTIEESVSALYVMANTKLVPNIFAAGSAVAGIAYGVLNWMSPNPEDKDDLPDGAATGPPVAPCSGTTGTATPETQGVADEVRQGAAGREESEADSTQHVGGEEWRREESRFPGGHESCEPTTHGPDDIDFEVKSSNPYAPDAGRASSLGYSVASVPDDVLAVSGKSMLGQDETGEPTTSMVRDESLDESPNGEGVPDVGGEAASSAGLGVSFGSRPLGDSFLCSIHA